ncbi:unnamed protein product [Amoebophrya sp. A25]|nr:unnamed protein product [Amoebophrya sp. A25]|eukprot:GSA25T00002312001.1
MTSSVSMEPQGGGSSSSSHSPVPASLGLYCQQQGFPEFASYCGTHPDIVQNCIEDLTRALLEERPKDPRQFLLHRLRDEYPLEKFSVGRRSLSEGCEIGVDRFIRLFEATRNITHEIVPSESISICIRESVRLLQCDRVSIFIYDKKIKMLILSASNLSKPIRVNPGQGIAGHVFKTGETVNIPDCYQDSRFDPSFDKLTGYHTKSMLVKPIHDFEGEVSGVLQAINKDDGITTVFTEADEIVIQNFMQLVGITLRNAEVYRDAIAHCKRAQGMISMLNSLPKNLGSQSMILTLTTHAHELVQSDHCAVFIHEESKGTLWSLSTAEEMRIPEDKGIVGAAIREKQTINVENVNHDARYCEHENLCGKSSNTRAETMLVVPLLVPDGARALGLGLIVMQNKREFDGEIAAFNDEDIEIMETFAKLAADRIKDSTFSHQTSGPKLTEAGRIFGSNLTNKGSGDPTSSGSLGAGRARGTSTYRSTRGDNAIREADDEDEEDLEMPGSVKLSPRSSARKSARLSVSGVKNGKTAAEELDRLLQERGKESSPDAAGMPTLLQSGGRDSGNHVELESTAFSSASMREDATEVEKTVDDEK